MRWPTLLLLLACTTAPPRPERAEPLRLEIRLASARKATQTHLGTYVWPTSAPPQELGADDPLCLWWQGAREGIPTAHAGLRDGSLRWGLLTVTRFEIQFGGERVLLLTDGLPEPDQVQGRSLPALSEVLVAARAHLDTWYEVCGSVYRDRPLLVVDADASVETVGLVLQTASDLRFPRVAALVRDPSPGDRREMDPSDPGNLAVIRQRGEQLEAFSADGSRRHQGPIRDMQSLLASVLAGERYGCTLIIGEGQTRWEELAATVDTTQNFRAHSSFVLFEPKTSPPAPPPVRPRSPIELLSPDRRAAVLWLELPSVQWRDVTKVPCDAIIPGPLGREAPLPNALRAALDSHDQEIPTSSSLPSEISSAQELSLSVVGPFEPGTPEAPSPALLPLLDRARACVEEARERPESPSTVALGFEIGPDGGIFDRYTASFDSQDPVHDCLKGAFEAIERTDPLGEGRYAAVVIGLKVR